ncbi:polymorphic toxin-type HINT domain-containing protein [Aquabacterium humicola]|uniref:polymorphic toxin-type HINT domain-containing protein n=1 Tax=Aquabacterium humicola TaxID=3237377 RepID=UPI00254283B3|nr:polymorphic toxin-type HINT domain-containing protein [Rubrivivax pictus]
MTLTVSGFDKTEVLQLAQSVVMAAPQNGLDTVAEIETFLGSAALTTALANGKASKATQHTVEGSGVSYTLSWDASGNLTITEARFGKSVVYQVGQADAGPLSASSTAANVQTFVNALPATALKSSSWTLVGSNGRTYSATQSAAGDMTLTVSGFDKTEVLQLAQSVVMAAPQNGLDTVAEIETFLGNGAPSTALSDALSNGKASKSGSGSFASAANGASYTYSVDAAGNATAIKTVFGATTSVAAAVPFTPGQTLTLAQVEALFAQAGNALTVQVTIQANGKVVTATVDARGFVTKRVQAFDSVVTTKWSTAVAVGTLFQSEQSLDTAMAAAMAADPQSTKRQDVVGEYTVAGATYSYHINADGYASAIKSAFGVTTSVASPTQFAPGQSLTLAQVTALFTTPGSRLSVESTFLADGKTVTATVDASGSVSKSLQTFDAVVTTRWSTAVAVGTVFASEQALDSTMAALMAADAGATKRQEVSGTYTTAGTTYAYRIDAAGYATATKSAFGITTSVAAPTQFTPGQSLTLDQVNALFTTQGSRLTVQKSLVSAAQGETVNWTLDAAGHLTVTKRAFNATTVYQLSGSYPPGTSLTLTQVNQVLATDANQRKTVSGVFAAQGLSYRINATGSVVVEHTGAFGVDWMRELSADNVPPGTVFADATALQAKYDDTKDHVTSYINNALGQRTATVDAEMGATMWSYDAFGSVKSMRAYATKATARVNAAGTGPEVTSNALDRVTAYTYRATGQLDTETEGGIVKKHAYTAFGELASMTAAWGTAEAQTQSWTYDAAGRELTHTDGEGNTSSRKYTAFGELSEETNENYLKLISSDEPYYRHLRFRLGIKQDATLGVAAANLTAAHKAVLYTATTTYFKYDALGRVSWITDANGVKTHKEYTAFGEEWRTTEAAGVAQQERVTVREFYDNGRVKKITDPMLYVTQFTYNVFGDQETVTDAKNVTETRTFDGNGRMLTSTRDGRVTTNVYDAFGNLKVSSRRFLIADAKLGFDERATAYQYDKLNRQTHVTDGEGYTQLTTYTAFGQKKSVTTGLYLMSPTDPAFNAEKAAAATSQQTKTEYDALGRVDTTTDGEGNVSKKVYDKAGNLRQETQAYNGLASDRPVKTQPRTVIYSYDKANRLIQVDRPDGGQTKYAYDAMGNKIGETVRLREAPTLPPIDWDFVQDVVQHLPKWSITDALQKLEIWEAIATELYGTPLVAESLAGLFEKTTGKSGWERLPSNLDTFALDTVAVARFRGASTDAGLKLYQSWEDFAQVFYGDRAAAGMLREQFGGRNFASGKDWDMLPAELRFGKASLRLDAERVAQFRGLKPFAKSLAKYSCETLAITLYGSAEVAPSLEKIFREREFAGGKDWDLLPVEIGGRRLDERLLNKLRAADHGTLFVTHTWTSIALELYGNADLARTLTERFGGRDFAGGADWDALPLQLGDYRLDQEKRSLMRQESVSKVITSFAKQSWKDLAQAYYGDATLGSQLLEFFGTAPDSLGEWDWMPDDIGGSKVNEDVVAEKKKYLYAGTKYEYDGVGRLKAVVDDVGTRTEHTYDAVGNLRRSVRGIDKSGSTANARSVEIEYDLNNRKVADIDAKGKKTRYEYDGVGNRISATNALGHVARYYYNASRELVCMVDPEGNATTIRYDSAGNRIEQTLRWTKVLGALDPHVVPSDSAVPAKDRTTRYEYDRRGLQRAEELLDGPLVGGVPTATRTEFRYDGSGNRTQEIQFANTANRRTTYYKYDSNGRVKEIQTGTFILEGAGGQATRYTYDCVGSVVVEEKCDFSGWSTGGTPQPMYGNVWQRIERDYERMNRVKSERLYDLSGGSKVLLSERRFTYDVAGMLSSERRRNGQIEKTSALGIARTYQYDTLNRRTSEHDELGEATTSEYDLVGNLRSVTDRRGFVTTYKYDENDRLIAEIQPPVKIYTVARAAAKGGNGEDSVSPTKSYTYDDAGRLVQVVEGAGNGGDFAYAGKITNNYYDRNGRIVAVRDADNVLREYQYDALGNRIKETLHMTRLSGVARDLFTRPAAPGGETRVTTLDYDPAGRLIKKTFSMATISSLSTSTDASGNQQPIVTSSTTALYEEFQYNEFGDLVKTRDRAGNWSLTWFDQLHRVIATVDALGYLKKTGFDTHGNATHQYVYTDPLPNPSGLSISGAPPQPATGAKVDLTIRSFDATGRLIAELSPIVEVFDPTAPDSAAFKSMRPRTTYEYDLAGRVFRKTVGDSSHYGGMRIEYFLYDEVGRMVAAINASRVMTVLSYDESGNLTRSERLYGKVPEGITITPSSNPAALKNALTERPADAAQKHDQITEFEYDGLNRLTSQCDTTAAGDLTKSFSYDLVGNRTWTKDEDGFISRSAYDGMDRVVEAIAPEGTATEQVAAVQSLPTKRTSTSTVFEYDAAGSVVRQYAGLPGLSVSLASDIRMQTTSDGVRIEWAVRPGVKNSWIVYSSKSIGGNDGINLYPSKIDSAASNAWISTADVGDGVYFRVVTEDEAGNIAFTEELSATMPPKFSAMSKVVTASSVTITVTFDAGAIMPRLRYGRGNELDRSVSFVEQVGNPGVWEATVSSVDPTQINLGIEWTDVSTGAVYLNRGPDPTTFHGLGLTAKKTPYSRAAIQRSDGTPIGMQMEASYNALGYKIRSVDGQGLVRAYGVNALGVAVQTWVKGTNEAQNERDADNLTYSARVMTWAESDARGRVVTEWATRRQLPNGTWLAPETRYTYDAYDRVRSKRLPGNVTPGDANAWLYEYDARGLKTKETDPLQNSTYIYYDQFGNVTGTKTALGYVSRKFYDFAGRMVKEADAEGNAVGYGYDHFDRKVSMTDGRGMVAGAAAGSFTTKYEYDDRDRLIAVRQAQGWHLANDNAKIYKAERVALGFDQDAADLDASEKQKLLDIYTQTFAYDGRNNRILTISNGSNDGKLNVQRTEEKYDGLGRVFETIRKVTQRDANGLVLNGGSASAVTTTWYDAYGHVLYQRDAEGGEQRKSYGRFGRLESSFDGVQTVHYTYNKFGLVEREYAAAVGGVFGGLAKDIAKAYDNDGNLTKIDNKTTKIKTDYTYTWGGQRSTEKIFQDGVLVRDYKYTYDAKSQMVRWQDHVTYMHMNQGYDADGNLTNVYSDSVESAVEPVFGGRNPMTGEQSSDTKYRARDQIYEYYKNGRLRFEKKRYHVPAEPGVGGDPGLPEKMETKIVHAYDYDAAYNTVAFSENGQGFLYQETDGSTGIDANNRRAALRQNFSNANGYKTWKYDARGNATESGSSDNNGASWTSYEYIYFNELDQVYRQRSATYKNNLLDSHSDKQMVLDLNGHITEVKDATPFLDGKALDYYTRLEYDYVDNGLQKAVTEFRHFKDGTVENRGTANNYFDADKVRRELNRGGGAVRTFVADNEGHILFSRDDSGKPDYASSLGLSDPENHTRIVHGEYFYANGYAVGERIGSHDHAPNDPTFTHPKQFVSWSFADPASSGNNRPQVLNTGYYGNGPFLADGPGTNSSYQVRDGDTWQLIAAAFTGNPSLGYRIAEANGNVELRAGMTVRVPNLTQSGTITAANHQVYDESEISGSLLPNYVPRAVNPDCGAQAGLLVLTVVIAAVVTICTYGAGTAISAAIIGAGVSGAAAVAATAAATAAVGAAFAAAGSAIEQGIKIATGFQDEFRAGDLGVAAIGGAFSGAAAGVFAGMNSVVALQGVKGLSESAQAVAKLAAGALGMAGSTTSQLLQDGDGDGRPDGKISSWSAIATAGVGAVLGASLGNPANGVSEGLQKVGAAAVTVGGGWLGLAEAGKSADFGDWANAFSSTLDAATSFIPFGSNVGNAEAVVGRTIIGATTDIVAGGLAYAVTGNLKGAPDWLARQVGSSMASATTGVAGAYVGEYWQKKRAANERLEARMQAVHEAERRALEEVRVEKRAKTDSKSFDAMKRVSLLATPSAGAAPSSMLQEWYERMKFKLEGSQTALQDVAPASQDTGPVVLISPAQIEAVVRANSPVASASASSAEFYEDLEMNGHLPGDWQFRRDALRPGLKARFDADRTKSGLEKAEFQEKQQRRREDVRRLVSNAQDPETVAFDDQEMWMRDPNLVFEAMKGFDAYQTYVRDYHLGEVSGRDDTYSMYGRLYQYVRAVEGGTTWTYRGGQSRGDGTRLERNRVAPTLIVDEDITQRVDLAVQAHYRDLKLAKDAVDRGALNGKNATPYSRLSDIQSKLRFKLFQEELRWHDMMDVALRREQDEALFRVASRSGDYDYYKLVTDRLDESTHHSRYFDREAAEGILLASVERDPLVAHKARLEKRMSSEVDAQIEADIKSAPVWVNLSNAKSWSDRVNIVTNAVAEQAASQALAGVGLVADATTSVMGSSSIQPYVDRYVKEPVRGVISGGIKQAFSVPGLVARGVDYLYDIGAASYTLGREIFRASYSPTAAIYDGEELWTSNAKDVTHVTDAYGITNYGYDSSQGVVSAVSNTLAWGALEILGAKYSGVAGAAFSLPGIAGGFVQYANSRTAERPEGDLALLAENVVMAAGALNGGYRHLRGSRPVSGGKVGRVVEAASVRFAGLAGAGEKTVVEAAEHVVQAAKAWNEWRNGSAYDIGRMAPDGLTAATKTGETAPNLRALEKVADYWERATASGDAGYSKRIAVDESGRRLEIVDDGDANGRKADLEYVASKRSPDDPHFVKGLCFAAGTLVHVPDDGPKVIEDVEVGDLVLALNDEYGNVEARRVIRLFRNTNLHILEVAVRGPDGKLETISATTEHPFWVVGRSWTPANRLVRGDVLTSLDSGGLHVVESVTDLGLAEATYNFEVEDLHNYFVGNAGILVHNDSIRPESGDGSSTRRSANSTVKEVFYTENDARASQHDVATAAIGKYLPVSLDSQREFGGLIVRAPDGTIYAPSPKIGVERGLEVIHRGAKTTADLVPDGHQILGFWHTHPGRYNTEFTTLDITAANTNIPGGVDIYVGVHDGGVKHYPANGRYVVEAGELAVGGDIATIARVRTDSQKGEKFVAAVDRPAAEHFGPMRRNYSGADAMADTLRPDQMMAMSAQDGNFVVKAGEVAPSRDKSMVTAMKRLWNSLTGGDYVTMARQQVLDRMAVPFSVVDSSDPVLLALLSESRGSGNLLGKGGAVLGSMPSVEQFAALTRIHGTEFALGLDQRSGSVRLYQGDRSSVRVGAEDAPLAHTHPLSEHALGLDPRYDVVHWAPSIGDHSSSHFQGVKRQAIVTSDGELFDFAADPKYYKGGPTRKEMADRLAQMTRDADAVGRGEMSYDEFAARHNLPKLAQEGHYVSRAHEADRNDGGRPSLLSRIAITTVSWIDRAGFPEVDLPFVVGAGHSWKNRAMMGLIGTSNPEPPQRIEDVSAFRANKQFRCLMSCEVDLQTSTVTSRIIDPGYTPPIDPERFSTPLARTAARLALPSDPTFHPGEASSVSDIVTGRLHPNSTLSLKPGQTPIVSGLTKFRAGDATDSLGIYKAKSPTHVPWVWVEFALVNQLGGPPLIMAQGSEFPSHRIYVNGTQVTQRSQAQVRAPYEPLLTTGQRAWEVRVPGKFDRGAGPVTGHDFAIPAGAGPMIIDPRTKEFGTLRGMGSRGIRNTEILTPAQERQLYQHVGELGLNPDDFLVSSHVSAYSDNWDKVFLGPNMFRATEGTGTVKSVFESMTPRAAVAHEAGHMIATRAGLAFEAGSLFDEVNASLTGRDLPGLDGVERYQLLRDAAERSRLEGRDLRDVLRQMQAIRNGR